MESSYKTHSCGELTTSHVGKTVVLNGWVQKRRGLGGLIFLDLRDRSGTVQVVCNPESSPKAAQIADQVRREYVLAIKGEVVGSCRGYGEPENEDGGN